MAWPVADHNAACWLAVRWLEAHFRRGKYGYRAGWYVVRICPCHDGLPVTACYDSQERAEQAMRVLNEVSAW